MADTIPGGAYKLPDGSWINAAGKRIAAPKGNVYIRPETEENPTEGEVTPGADRLPGGDEYSAPETMVSDEAPKIRRSRKS